jgi:hypothetical protein
MKTKCEHCKTRLATCEYCVYLATIEYETPGVADEDAQFDAPDPEYEIRLCDRCSTLDVILGREKS